MRAVSLLFNLSCGYVPGSRPWLTLDEPSLLFLNGRAEPRPNSKTSIFVAKMFQQPLQYYEIESSLDNTNTAIVPLGFFHGQHRDRQKDSNGNPEELAMSLLLQLIDRGRCVLDPVVL
jgi:hypothetical protein